MTTRVVVITGASGGIGAALAQVVSSRGAATLLVARRELALCEVAARCGDLALPVVADVTRRLEVKRVVSEALAGFGHVDVWVNNVGRGISRMPSKLTGEDIDETMRANVKSALYGMQEILPHFQRRGTGHIINVSAMLGRAPFTTIRSAYVGAKHYLNALTATFRAEIQETHPDIQVSLVSPDVVRTDFGRNAMHGGPDSQLLFDAQSAEEVAEVIANVIETRVPDAYTFPGAKSRIVSYYSGIGTDPK